MKRSLFLFSFYLLSLFLIGCGGKGPKIQGPNELVMLGSLMEMGEYWEQKDPQKAEKLEEAVGYLMQVDLGTEGDAAAKKVVGMNADQLIKLAEKVKKREAKTYRKLAKKGGPKLSQLNGWGHGDEVGPKGVFEFWGKADPQKAEELKDLWNWAFGSDEARITTQEQEALLGMNADEIIKYLSKLKKTQQKAYRKLAKKGGPRLDQFDSVAFDDEVTPEGLFAFWETADSEKAKKLKDLWDWSLSSGRTQADGSFSSDKIKITQTEQEALVGMNADEMIKYLSKLKKSQDQAYRKLVKQGGPKLDQLDESNPGDGITPRRLMSFWDKEDAEKAKKLVNAWNWAFGIETSTFFLFSSRHPRITQAEQEALVGMNADEMIKYISKLKKSQDQAYRKLVKQGGPKLDQLNGSNAGDEITPQRLMSFWDKEDAEKAKKLRGMWNWAFGTDKSVWSPEPRITKPEQEALIGMKADEMIKYLSGLKKSQEQAHRAFVNQGGPRLDQLNGSNAGDNITPRDLVAFWEQEDPEKAKELVAAWSWIADSGNPETRKADQGALLGMNADEVIRYVSQLKIRNPSR